jgi:hypothetical protein
VTWGTDSAHDRSVLDWFELHSLRDIWALPMSFVRAGSLKLVANLRQAWLEDSGKWPLDLPRFWHRICIVDRMYIAR